MAIDAHDLEVDRSEHSSIDTHETRKMTPAPAKGTPNERTPLITTSAVPETGQDPLLAEHQHSWQYIVLLLVSILVLAQCGDRLTNSPIARIKEAIICYNYYEKADPSKLLVGREAIGPGAIGGVAEKLCKVDEVQSELASLNGYQDFLDGVPSLLFALPYGWAADKYGRKPILIMGVTAFVWKLVSVEAILWLWQAFDVRWTWVSAAAGVFAGCSPVVSALFFTVIADVTPQAERAGVFLRVGAANILPDLLMPLVSAWLMTYNPWIPNVIGVIVLCSSLVVALMVPETLNLRHPHGTPSSSHPPSPSAEDLPEPPDPSTEPKIISLDYPIRWLTGVRSASAFLWNDWRVPVLIFPFMVHMLMAMLTTLLLQYFSKRYDLTFSTATLILTIRAGLNVAVLFAGLPYATKVVTRYWRLCGQRKDLYLSRASFALNVLGYLMLGASPTIATTIISLVVLSGGMGAAMFVRSFLTSLVPAHHVARLYSLIGMVDTVGAMLGSPLLFALFKRGMSLGGLGIGLPFYFLSLASLTVLVLLCVVGMRKRDRAQESAERDEQQ